MFYNFYLYCSTFLIRQLLYFETVNHEFCNNVPFLTVLQTSFFESYLLSFAKSAVHKKIYSHITKLFDFRHKQQSNLYHNDKERKTSYQVLIVSCKHVLQSYNESYIINQRYLHTMEQYLFLRSQCEISVRLISSVEIVFRRNLQ